MKPLKMLFLTLSISLWLPISFPTISFAANTPSIQEIQKQVAALTQAVLDLKKEVARLEEKVQRCQPQAESRTDYPTMPSRETRASSSNNSSWRALQTGMSSDQVRSILGEPERISGGNYAMWHYPNGGYVTLISGRLSSWNEPSSIKIPIFHCNDILYSRHLRLVRLTIKQSHPSCRST